MSADACTMQLNIDLSHGGLGGYPVFADEPRKLLLGTGGDGAPPRFGAIP